MKRKFITTIIFLCISLSGCKYYSISGIDVGDAKTVQIDFFKNEASLVAPSLSQKFTETLQELFTSQTNLDLISLNGDLYFSGEIIGYNIVPLSGLSNQKSAQNRLTVNINVRFINKLNDLKNFEKIFSFYSDFEANSQLTKGILDNALSIINERISQDIFNLAVSNNF